MWANQAVADGIHLAYRSRDFGYDWLPLYLYVSKLVGLFYRHTGLAGAFGNYSHLLTVVLKLTMTLFHLVTVALVYRIGRGLNCPQDRSLLAAATFGIAPGTVLATAAFGYQDAFHTMIVVAALWCVVCDRVVLSTSLTVAAALTKPQAAIYLGPFWLYLISRGKTRDFMQAIGLAVIVCAVVLSPFLFYDTLSDVYQMYRYVPSIHQWLTGCAHNVWWLLAPIPPFLSDREPIFLGLNGLEIGLGSFALFSGLTVLVILTRRDARQLAHSSAYLGFAFFMVVTQIHENHLYACFPFLAIAAIEDRRLYRLFGVLTITFAADLVLTLYLLYTNTPISVGPVRLSLVNAGINVGALVIWTSIVVRDLVAVGRVKRPG